MTDDVIQKPLYWVGSSRDDLRVLSEGVRREVGFALMMAQSGKKHTNVKPLHGFGGAGVLEVVANDEGGTYRAVYTVRFEDSVYVLHVFQKKSSSGVKTSKRDIDLLRDRLARAEEHHRSLRAG
jgi:phage-related protein